VRPDSAQKTVASLKIFSALYGSECSEQLLPVVGERADDLAPDYSQLLAISTLQLRRCADPSQVTGTREEKLSKVRVISDQIKKMILEFVQERSTG
jgi:hypothetical protein